MALQLCRKQSHLRVFALRQDARLLGQLCCFTNKRPLSLSRSLDSDRKELTEKSAEYSDKEKKYYDEKDEFRQEYSALITNRFAAPNKFSKMCLMVSNQYQHKDEIPEFVSKAKLRKARDYALIIFNSWFVIMMFIWGTTLFSLRRNRRIAIEDSLYERQMREFEGKNKLYDERYKLKKLAEKEFKEQEAAKETAKAKS